ncbi:MAG: hypothetical protein LBH20_02020 [Treponema sp.]|jgi:hypothetical protein|nr:hypothetical protein [Treponema sp.]
MNSNIWGYSIKKFLFMFLLPLAVLSAADKNNKVEEPASYETKVTFHGFSWGTSTADVIKKMGKPLLREEWEDHGLTVLAWENVEVNGYTTYMLAYFSQSGLQGGTYYFLTYTTDELMRCYSEVRQELRDRFGPTYLFDGIVRELRPYESAWNLPSGYVCLKVNAREGDPVMLWYTSPELTKKIYGDIKPVTTKK